MQRVSTFTLINIAGLLSACAYAYLAFSSQAYADIGLTEFWLVSGFCVLVCFASWYYLHRTGDAIPVGTILFWALVFRCIGVAGYPILEDDIFRYLWDGRMLIEAGSPYGIAPASFFADESLSAKFEEILDNINYPYINTVYGPVTQWSFALAYLLAPGEVWPLQLLYGLLDFVVILFLLRLAPAKYVLLYAWCPLLIKEFSFTAHPDILGVFFLVAAVLLVRREYRDRAAVLLALAVGSKIFALIIAPLLIGLRWRAWGVFFLTLVCITLPFLPTNPWLSGGLKAMSDVWLFNAPIYYLFLGVIPLIWIKLPLLLTFIIFWCSYSLTYFRHYANEIPRGDWIFGVFFLCVPVVNAWYLVWLLPFAVIYPSRWAWTASVAVLLSYAIGLNLPDSNLEAYQQPVSMIALEYILILLALIIDINRGNLRQSNSV